MIDEDNILDSGILERYLTGDLSSDEETKLEALLERNASLRARVSELEESLETIAQDNAIAPPSIIKELVLNALPEQEKSRKNSEKKPTNFYLAIASSLAVILGSLAFWFYNETATLKSKVDLVNTENQQLQKSVETLQTTIKESENKYNALANPNTSKYILKGNNNLPNALAVAYINLAEKTVFVNTTRLPELPKDNDYQMWADVKGEMINMGILKRSEDLLTMQFIDNASSINITIEPKGGSIHATVENLIANYYVTP